METRVKSWIELQEALFDNTWQPSLQRFRANFGNGNIRMTVNGKRYNAAKLEQPVGYEFRPGKAPKRLSERVRVGLCAT